MVMPKLKFPSGRLHKSVSRARFMAVVLLLQSLMPMLSYAALEGSADALPFFVCKTTDGLSPAGEQSQNGVKQMNCPVCMFYGQLSTGATVVETTLVLHNATSKRTPLLRAPRPPAFISTRARPIRAPPA